MPDRTTIRVLGIDTPETVDPRRPVQCFGAEASARAHALLDGQSVSLEFDASQGREDRYGRTLAYVWLPDGRSFDETMIADGYAHEYTYDTPYRYQHAYQQAETEARRADRGLWARRRLLLTPIATSVTGRRLTGRPHTDHDPAGRLPSSATVGT